MGTIINLTTKQLIVSRLTTVSGNKKTYATTTGALAEIQPVALDKTPLYEGAMGKLFNLYADPAYDIKPGDRLRETATGNEYKVRNGGVSRRTMGSIDFLHVVVEQIN